MWASVRARVSLNFPVMPTPTHCTPGSEAIAALLRTNSCPSLEALDLSWNLLRDAGLARVLDGVAANEHLQSLDLSWNAFGVESLAAVAQAVSSNATLKTLVLDHTNMGGDGALILETALRNNTCLSRLSLRGCPLGATGGRAIIRAMAVVRTRSL